MQCSMAKRFCSRKRSTRFSCTCIKTQTVYWRTGKSMREFGVNPTTARQENWSVTMFKQFGASWDGQKIIGMRFVVFGILDMRWKYRKMVEPQERLFMQSFWLHEESFLQNDIFHDKNKSEPIANRHKVRIYSLWWTQGGSNPWPPHCERGALPAELWARMIFSKDRSLS